MELFIPWECTLPQSQLREKCLQLLESATAGILPTVHHHSEATCWRNNESISKVPKLNRLSHCPTWRQDRPPIS
ncbi:MAG TPA: hypothetical protein VGR57_16150, partial [Ktedonobacterales bacterium]|nr:hypothetical protein [Ktedonobacterales bacterium]